MAELNEIISQKEVDKLVALAQAMQAVDSSLAKIVKTNQTAAESSKALNDAQKETERLNKEQAKTLDTLDKQRQKAYQDMAKQEAKEKDLSDAINKEAKSLQELQKQNLALIAARNKIDTTTKAGQKAIADYNKQIDKNTEAIRKNNDFAGKQRMNIGNYLSALSGLPGPIGAVTSKIGTMGTALKALMLNPIVAFIAALVLGLKLLYDAFKSTGEGADTLEQTTGALAATYKVITDRIGQVITGNMKLRDAFKGVNQAVIETALSAAAYAAAIDKIGERTVLFTSEEADLKREESELSRTYKDATKSTEERIAAYERVLAIEGELLAFRKEAAAETYRAKLVEVATAQQATNFTIGQIESFIKMNTYAAEQVKENDPLWAAFWNTNEEGIKELETAYATLQNTETEYFDATAKQFGKLISFKEQLEKEATAAALLGMEERKKQDEANAINATRKLEITKLSHIEAEQVVTDTHLAGLQAREVADIDFAAREMERLEIQKQAKLSKAQEYVTAIADIGNMLLSINQMQIDQEVQDMEQAKAYELQLAGDNSVQVAAINKKYAAEERQLKIKQAKQNKTAALFQAIIGTAMAVINGLATVPFFPLGLIMSVLAGVLGGVQIGMIASQPIPTFAKGTKKAPKGLAVVGERGRELIMGPDGSVNLSPSTATLVNMGRGGHRIIPNRETELLIRAAKGADDFTSRAILNELQEGNWRLIETVKNKSELHIYGGGRKITERKGNYYKTYYNKKILS